MVGIHPYSQTNNSITCCSCIFAWMCFFFPYATAELWQQTLSSSAKHVQPCGAVRETGVLFFLFFRFSLFFLFFLFFRFSLFSLFFSLLLPRNRRTFSRALCNRFSLTLSSPLLEDICREPEKSTLVTAKTCQNKFNPNAKAIENKAVLANMIYPPSTSTSLFQFLYCYCHCQYYQHENSLYCESIQPPCITVDLLPLPSPHIPPL